MALELSERYQRVVEAGAFQSLVSPNPWPHFVLDDLIPPDVFRILQRRLLEQNLEFELVDGHPAKLKLCYMQDLELAAFFFSGPMRALLEGIAGCRLRPNEELAIQFRQMTPESPAFAPHEDLIDSPTLIALYYVAPGWTPGCGGELVMLEDEHTETDRQKPVAPIENRLVLFASEKRCWHAINRVQNWNRLMVLTEWLMTE